MRSSLLILGAVVVLVVASLTGLVYCWQQDLSEFGPLFGSIISLFAFLGTVGFGLWYGGRLAFKRIDGYVRDVSSATAQIARETASDTVESLPQTLMDGLERSVERAGGRVFGRSSRTSPSWRQRFLPSDDESSEEDDDVNRDIPDSGRRPPRSERSDRSYRNMLDDAIAEARAKREQSDMDDEKH